MSSCPLCVHMSKLSIPTCVQPFMYRMHALYIVELALTSHSRLCGGGCERGFSLWHPPLSITPEKCRQLLTLCNAAYSPLQTGYVPRGVYYYAST